MGATMGQEVVCNGQPLEALVRGRARILSCLHSLLSGTATSCPKSLARSCSDAGQTPTRRLATQSLPTLAVGKEAPSVESIPSHLGKRAE